MFNTMVDTFGGDGFPEIKTKKRNKSQMFWKRCLIYFSRTIFSFSNSSDVDATQCICLQLETPPSARVYNPLTKCHAAWKIWLKPVTTYRIGRIRISCTTKFKNSLSFLCQIWYSWFVSHQFYQFYNYLEWLIDKRILIVSRGWICC